MADCNAPETRAHYRAMRAASPVHYDPRFRSFCVFRYADARAVLTDWASFSSDYGRLAPGSALDRVFEGDMNATDPPRHARLRGLISRAFTPRRVMDLAPSITRITHELLDAIAPRGECELNEHFSGVMPLLVIAALLGVPGEQRAHLRKLTLEAIENFESIVSGRPVDGRAQEELDAYFRGLIEARRRRPEDDLISQLLEAEIDGERLAERDLLVFCKVLIIAGNTTTSRFITSAVLTLLEHPEALAEVRAEPTLLPAALEEALRFRPPINAWFRLAARDVELAGQTIPAKQQVVVILGSANRDEAVFADPDRFDIRRSPNPHLAFSGGVHFCLGAALARLEGQIAVEAILRRLPDLELANTEPLEPYKGIQPNGVVRLPLRFGSQERARALSPR